MEKSSSSRQEVRSADSGVATPREAEPDSLPVFDNINKDQISNVRERPAPTETMTMPVVGQTKLTKDERTLITENFVSFYFPNFRYSQKQNATKHTILHRKND